RFCMVFNAASPKGWTQDVAAGSLAPFDALAVYAGTARSPVEDHRGTARLLAPGPRTAKSTPHVRRRGTSHEHAREEGRGRQGEPSRGWVAGTGNPSHARYYILY